MLAPFSSSCSQTTKLPWAAAHHKAVSSFGPNLMSMMPFTANIWATAAVALACSGHATSPGGPAKRANDANKFPLRMLASSVSIIITSFGSAVRSHASRSRQFLSFANLMPGQTPRRASSGTATSSEAYLSTNSASSNAKCSQTMKERTRTSRHYKTICTPGAT